MKLLDEVSRLKVLGRMMVPNLICGIKLYSVLLYDEIAVLIPDMETVLSAAILYVVPFIDVERAEVLLFLKYKFAVAD